MAAGGFDGVVAKSAVACCFGGDRCTAWLKVKAVKRQEFVVIGWRPPTMATSMCAAYSWAATRTASWSIAAVLTAA